MADPRPASSILSLVPSLAAAVARPFSPEEQAADDARYRRELWLAQQGGSRVDRLMRQGVPEKAAKVIAEREVVPTTAVRYAHKFMGQTAKLLLVLAGTKDATKTTAAGVALDLALTVWLAEGGASEKGPRLIPAELLRQAWNYFDRTKERAAPVEPVTRTNQALLLSCPFLALDDIGQEEPHHAEYVGEALEILVCRRCDAGLRTIITTNYVNRGAPNRDGVYDGLLGRYPARAQRLEQRIKEHGVWAKCEATNFRPREVTTWDERTT